MESGTPDYRENTYFIDAESGTETARLIEQDQLMTGHMGGVFPERLDVTGVKRVLDLACGPGGWVLDVAYQYPHMEIIGVDISKTNVDYAFARARSQGRNNVDFEVMDITERLAFADSSLDLVNGRLMVGFMLPDWWPSLLTECMRILRTGGTLCLTETEWGLTNSEAFENYTLLVSQALKLAGQSFSPDGRHLGITPVLGKLIERAGFTEIQQQAHMIDFSAHREGHHVTCEVVQAGFQLLQPFIIRHGGARQEELNDLYQQLVMDMRSETFCGIIYYVSAWGKKPLK